MESDRIKITVPDAYMDLIRRIKAGDTSVPTKELEQVAGHCSAILEGVIEVLDSIARIKEQLKLEEPQQHDDGQEEAWWWYYQNRRLEEGYSPEEWEE